MVEHFCAKFGDPIATLVFKISFGITERQTNADENPTPVTAVGVGNYVHRESSPTSLQS